MVQLEYELAYYDSAVHRFNQWHHEDPPLSRSSSVYSYLTFNLNYDV